MELHQGAIRLGDRKIIRVLTSDAKALGFLILCGAHEEAELTQNWSVERKK